MLEPTEGAPLRRLLSVLAEPQRQGPHPLRRPEQRHGRPDWPSAGDHPRLCASRTTTTWPTVKDDALIEELARKGIGPVRRSSRPAGFSPLHSSTLSDVADQLGFTPMQVALAWLLHRSPNILLIPGTSSRGHLRENLAAAELDTVARGPGGARRIAATKP